MSEVPTSPSRELRTASRRSLSFRYVALIVGLVVTVGMLLGLAGTVASVRIAADERSKSLRYGASVVAASLIPVVADQDSGRIEAQLVEILGASSDHAIECIAIKDASGATIAEIEGGDGWRHRGQGGALLDVFTEPQVIVAPIVVDGLPVAETWVQYKPVGLTAALERPVRVTGIIVLAAMVASGLWGGFMVLRTVVEPIEELRDAAAEIANGRRDVVLSSTRSDEIGQLAAALDDMTRQLRRQEQDLVESYESLHRAFEEKTELAKGLERTMNAKSNFVAAVSHELRSPMAVLSLYGEMLQSEEFGRLDPQLGQAVGSMVAAVSRLSSIVQGLIDVAMLERGVITLEFADVPLHDLAAQAVADALVFAREREVRVELLHPVPERVVRVDGVRLRQALDNLLSNAVKFSPPDSVVSVHLLDDEKDLVIEVADEGPGVPEDFAGSLFDLFSRADNEDNATASGLGLGLAIADRIMRAHGGSVSFRPNPHGRGTVFSLRLPSSGVPARQKHASVKVVS